jgi:hypothetical protein
VVRWLTANAEFYGRLAAAAADAFDTFNAELERERTRNAGVVRSSFEGFASGNARFMEGLAEGSRRVIERLRPPDSEPRRRPVEELDYERLGKLVAAELRGEPKTTEA